MKKNPPLRYAHLFFCFMIYGLVPVSLKFAGRYELFSLSFMLFFGAALLLLVLYALIWQQVLRFFPLTVAYAGKAVVVLWGILWGYVAFQERVTAGMVAGAAIIVLGIGLAVKSDD